MAPDQGTRHRFGRFELQADERRLLADSQPVPLGPRAFDLLLALVERSGRLVTKSELLARIWGKVVVEDNALQAHISALRKALGPEAIATVAGQGYRFTLGVESVRSAPEPAPLPKHNLPVPLTSFIGREREIAELRRLLASTRLLTLTGAGGCGKTRLALQVAGTSQDGFADGVWLVELAPLGDAHLLAATVAKTLAVAAKPGQDVTETVAAWIGSRHLLLVLDNAEHLVDACARLVDRLLRQCGRLVIVVTSRERLAIDGELNYRVPSLSLPCGLSSAEVLTSEAARLFIDRARLQRPDFEVVTRQDAEALASICRRLDGIALAIELAAPCLRATSLQALSERLDDRFQVLTEGSRTALPRHRTLRSLIDWSHELLSATEQAVLRRASVFAGGWTLEAAERVCGWDAVARADVLDLLTSLADKSLVFADVRGEGTRFRMLETMRLYAQQRLRDSGEETATQARHLQVFIDMADGPGTRPNDAGYGRVIAQLDLENDNLRAALARGESEPGLLPDALRLAGLLHFFWAYRGHAEEGRHWLGRLLAAAPASGRGEVHAKALQVRGSLEIFAGNAQAGVAPLREAIALWRQLCQRGQLLHALGTLGEIERNRGDYLAARSMYDEALAIARELHDMRGATLALGSLAHVAVRLGEPDVARALLDECLTLARSLGPQDANAPLYALGWVRHLEGDLEGARAALSEAAQLYHEAGDLVQAAWALTMLSEVHQDLRDIAAARAWMREALETVPAGPLTWIEPSGLESLAGLSLDLGGAAAAARLYGCAQRLGEQHSDPSWNPQRHRGLVAAARQAMQDDAAFDAAWNEGRSWTLEEAIRCARTLL